MVSSRAALLSVAAFVAVALLGGVAFADPPAPTPTSSPSPSPSPAAAPPAAKAQPQWIVRGEVPRDPDNPGTSWGGRGASYWLYPFVRVDTRYWYGTTVTWMGNGHDIKRVAAFPGEISPGFAMVSQDVVQGIIEDWKIVLPKRPNPTQSYNQLIATPDSRVFIAAYHPQKGQIALDVYVHGKLASKLGPFYQYSGVAMGDDGNSSMIIWKDKSSAQAQLLSITPEGKIRFRVDCNTFVENDAGEKVEYVQRGVNGTTIPAPGGEGVLAYSNSQGDGDVFNTLEWYTREGKCQSVEFKWNPGLRGWIPGTHKSLIATSADGPDQFHLVDWDTGKILWTIPCPSKGPLLAVGVTPKFVIFSTAEPWQFPANGTISPGDMTRAFYAVNAQDGSIAARWLPQKWSHPRAYLGDGGGSFLWNGKTLYYMMGDDFLAIDPAEIENKTNGWK